ncbi:hypothetical protein QLX08_010269 [Tetragonisca angustula]|uniref:Uncharacterized protein n=1 Tax=Tetragonisca angustula TaxID=166442 RepID=A0AAW0ZCV0_9HYME
MIKPEGDDAIFGDEPKKLSSTPLSLQRRQTIFPNAIGLALDIDRGVPTLRSHNCIRIFDAWNISRKNTVNNRSTKERKYNSKLIMVRDYVLDRSVSKYKYTIYKTGLMIKMCVNYTHNMYLCTKCAIYNLHLYAN